LTGSDLKAKAIQLYGEHGWSSALAKAIGKSRYQIWRYSKLDNIPVTVALAVSTLRKK
jgi:hypothetical protein